MSDQVTINIVDDQSCPMCGARWGHENKRLDFPNRPKVDDWWRCYNPDCTCAYYHPETGEIEYEMSEEESAEMVERVKAHVDSIDFDKVEVIHVDPKDIKIVDKTTR